MPRGLERVRPAFLDKGKTSEAKGNAAIPNKSKTASNLNTQRASFIPISKIPGRIENTSGISKR